MAEFEEEVVATLSDRPSAEMPVSFLKVEGIPARIVSSGIEPSWTLGSPTAVSPLRVLVARAHVTQARAFLKEQSDAD